MTFVDSEPCLFLKLDLLAWRDSVFFPEGR
jgi:hypothetical protein